MSNLPPGEGGRAREQRGSFPPHIVRLAWTLAAAYLLVIAYASLQPLREWRVPPGEVLRFLLAAWPAYIPLADVAVNVAAYIPLGFLLSIGCGVRFGPARGALAAALAAAGVSLAMELVQMFLPARIASSVDLLANGLGALLGAMAAPLFAPTRILGGKLHALRNRLFLEGARADVGLVIVLLWPITQFHLTGQLFGTGGIRATFDLPARFAHTPPLAMGGEAAVALFSLLGVGLMTLALMRATPRALPVVGAVIGAALAIKLFTAIVLVRAAAPFAALTPGVLIGLLGGLALLYGAWRLPRPAQLALSALCIAVATVAINLVPDNPYHLVPARLLAGGTSTFLSFSGIARALSELWPLLALGYLLYVLGVRPRGAIEPGARGPAGFRGKRGHPL